jgi:hypothetical protein
VSPADFFWPGPIRVAGSPPIANQNYQYNVALTRNETRTRNVTVCEMVPTPENYQYNVTLTRNETRTRTVPVCEMVPTQQTYQYNVSLTRNETRTRNVTVSARWFRHRKRISTTSR